MNTEHTPNPSPNDEGRHASKGGDETARGDAKPASNDTRDEGLGDFSAVRFNAAAHQSAQVVLRSIFHDLVAASFSTCSGLDDEHVYQHYAGVLVANTRQDYVHDTLGLSDTQLGFQGQRVSHAQHLSQVINCCFDSQQSLTGRSALGDLFCFLGDQVVFLKGMFRPFQIERALLLSATKMPANVDSLTDLAAQSYARASQLVGDVDDDPRAAYRAELYERLSENVVYCIRGLQRVRQDLTEQAYGIGVTRQPFVGF